VPTLKVTLEYDGTAYAGWQRQPDQPTVQEAVERAVRSVSQSDIPVVAAGRTDAGVHALGQVASFRTDKALAPEDWLRALNATLPPDISTRSVELVPDDFHARYSATGKRYEYRILNRPERSALERMRAWHIYGKLNLDAMREAARHLVGKHDFSSFQGHPTDVDNPVCDLQRLEIIVSSSSPFPLPRREGEDEGEGASEIRIEFEADRFLKQMVRAMVGTLVEVGQEKRQPEEVKRILEAKDRRAAGYTAPAQGLYLMRVDYQLPSSR
jgi:tRNA pseudouridine38-40 synthase